VSYDEYNERQISSICCVFSAVGLASLNAVNATGIVRVSTC